MTSPLVFELVQGALQRHDELMRLIGRLKRT